MAKRPSPRRARTHPERAEDFAREEVAKALSRDALDDLGRQEDPHALIPEIRAGREYERGAHGMAGKFGEGCVSAAELGVLRKHVGKTGCVREQVADTDGRAVLAFEFGEVVRDRIVDREQAPFGQKHHRAGRDGLGDGGEQEDRAGVHRACAGGRRHAAEAFMEHDTPVAGHQQRGGQDAARGGLGFEQPGGIRQAPGGHPGGRRIGGTELGRSNGCHPGQQTDREVLGAGHE